MLYGAMLSWSSRNVQKDFNESKSLTFTISSIRIIIIYIVFIALIFMPIDYMIYDKPDYLVLIRSLGIIIGCCFAIILQIGHIFFYILYYLNLFI